MTTTSNIAPVAAARRRLTANFHFIKSCDFRCSYCYATFLDIVERTLASDTELIKLTQVLARRYTKVTFVGGEPTLYPKLHEMLAVARQAGAVTNVVTNGSRIDGAWLETVSPDLDLLTMSVDSADPSTHLALGRATRGVKALKTTDYIEMARAARRLGVGVKLNTVVTTQNTDEDMPALVREIAPIRWKILQATPVAGQNDLAIRSLAPSRTIFDAYVDSHISALRDTSTRIVPEPIEAIHGSYIMVDPVGRFFDSSAGGHHYSDPILSVGHDAAFAQVTFDETRFVARGGAADLG